MVKGGLQKKRVRGLVSSTAVIKEVIHGALEGYSQRECRMLMYQTPLSEFLKHRGSVNAGHTSPLQNARAAAPVGDAVIKPRQNRCRHNSGPTRSDIYGEITSE